jgi:hypothetical protein
MDPHFNLFKYYIYYRSFPSVHGWYFDERQKALKKAMQSQLEQHPQLLRVLLDTGDSLLVCCQRFTSAEAELVVGMRERDLRLLCSQVRLDTKQVSINASRASINERKSEKT